MKPLIGITGNFGDKGCELAKGYYQSVLEAGGSPVVIPPYGDEQALSALLDTLDGIVLSGGSDMNPLLVGEEPIPQLHGINPERDVPELMLIRMAYDRQIPILGICRGIQMLASALGGTIYQDLGVQYHDAPLIKHSQDLVREQASHTVSIEKESMLGGIFRHSGLVENKNGGWTLPVNSFHHQAVRCTGNLFRVRRSISSRRAERLRSPSRAILRGASALQCLGLRSRKRMVAGMEWLQ